MQDAKTAAHQQVVETLKSAMAYLIAQSALRKANEAIARAKAK